MKRLSILIMSLLLSLGAHAKVNTKSITANPPTTTKGEEYAFEQDYEKFKTSMNKNLKMLDDKVAKLKADGKEFKKDELEKYNEKKKDLSEDLAKLKTKTEDEYAELKTDISEDYEKLKKDVEKHF